MKLKKKKTYNFFEGLPWWLGGGLGGGALLVIEKNVRKFVWDHKDSPDILYESLGMTMIVLMIALGIVSIFLLVAFGKFKSATKKHCVLFPLFKSPKLNVIKLLFWMQLGFVVTYSLSFVWLFDMEWPLIDELNGCFLLLVAAVAILAGIRFNGFEKEHTGFNDQFGTWFIGYGIFLLMFFAANRLINKYLDEMTTVSTVLVAILYFINIALDAIYAYNIIRYSKQNVPVLFEIYEANNPDVTVQTQEYSTASQSRPHDPVSSASQKSEASADTKNCPYCGEEIKTGAKKCRYCGEWLEK